MDIDDNDNDDHKGGYGQFADIYIINNETTNDGLNENMQQFGINISNYNGVNQQQFGSDFGVVYTNSIKILELLTPK